jgi:uncharacterized protein
VIGAIAIGVAGGIIAGLMGVGGGVIFVPGMVIFLGLSQHQAEATSLLAIVPVAIVGAYTHGRNGNVRGRDGLMVGLFSLAGAGGGVAVANALPGEALRAGFAALLVVVAAQLARRALRTPVGARETEAAAGGRAQRSAQSAPTRATLRNPWD